MRWLAVTLGYATIKWLTNGTGTNDVIDKCLALGLRKPEFRQDEDFMVTLWRREGSGTVQSDPEVIQSDPERSKTDPNLLDAVYDLIKENHAISRAELARRLKTSERQVRKAIDELRGKKIRRRGGDSGEWEIIE